MIAGVLLCLATPIVLPARPAVISYDTSGFAPLSLTGPPSRFVVRGLALAERGEWREAFRAFDDGVRADPHDLAARAGRAQTAVRAGAVAELRKKLGALILGPWRNAPRGTPAPKGTAESWYELSFLPRDRQVGVDAVMACEQAMIPLFNPPGVPSLATRRGWPVRLRLTAQRTNQLGNNRPGIRAEHAGLMRDAPQSGAVRYQFVRNLADGDLGMAFISAKTGKPVYEAAFPRKPKEALRELAPLLRDHPDHPLVRYMAGYVYEVNDRPKDAVRFYRAYLQLEDPTPERVARRKDVVGRIARLAKR